MVADQGVEPCISNVMSVEWYVRSTRPQFRNWLFIEEFNFKPLNPFNFFGFKHFGNYMSHDFSLDHLTGQVLLVAFPVFPLEQ